MRTDGEVGAGLSERLEALVAALPVPGGTGVVSVWLGDLAGQVIYERESDAVHYAASTMKLPLLVAAYRRWERGELDLDRPVPVRNEFRSALDGSRFTMRQDYDQDDETWEQVGTEVTLRELVRRSVVRSGNLATNVVLDHVGAGAVADVLAAAGCGPETVLPCGIEDFTARAAGVFNVVTAADLGVLMAGVGAGTLARPETCSAIEQVLAQQEHRDKIPAGLLPSTYVANKTGWIDGASHDVALVRPDNAAPYVLAVCTTADAAEEELSRLIARISRAVWEARAREDGG